MSVAKAAKKKQKSSQGHVTALWQRAGGKKPGGGLTEAGAKSYRDAHPGSKLQTAVTTKPSKLKPGSKDAKRRASFCARMGGVKSKMTNDKNRNDPKAPVNKTLRDWNC
jgi:hypothetical protein